MISVGIKELRTRLSRYVERVRKGDAVVVTEHGKDVALLLPISRERRAIKKLVNSGRAAWLGAKPRGVKGIKIKGGSISKTVAEERH